MKQEEELVQRLRGLLEGKRILELACGSAAFSLAAAPYAESVVCLDLDDSRLNPGVQRTEKIRFLLADAEATGLEDASFDRIVLYNAFFHVAEKWPSIRREAMRLLKPDGTLLVISSWKIDKARMERELFPIEQLGPWYVWKDPARPSLVKRNTIETETEKENG